MRRFHIVAIATLVACWSGVAAAQSVGVPPPNTPAAGSLKIKMLHKAAPDECFAGIGSSANIFPADASQCAGGTMAKVNQSYVWGLTQFGNMLWYGTSANQLCAVISSVFAETGIPAPAYQTDCYVCEFAKSNFLVIQRFRPPSATGVHRTSIRTTCARARWSIAPRTIR
jgi:hypothetical protein